MKIFLLLFLNLLILVATNFQGHEIVPDVIDQAPETILEVLYSNNVKVETGNILTPTEVKAAPFVNWNSEPNYFYTLIMVDPDAPSRKDPQFREWNHWLVVNIPANEFKKGEVLYEYIGAAPPQGTGFHRYVILLCRQPSLISFNEVHLSQFSGKDRGGFNVRSFIKEYGLELVAGNFFLAKYDDYVPILHRQLYDNNE